MAKRFSDTDKWKKSFFRGLQGPYKLLWMYVLDDCDIAGVWHVDMEVASLRIGEEVTLKKALELFGDRVTPFDHGKKWFISDFIFFQYGDLSTTNRMHNAVIKILKSNNIDFPLEPKEGASKGLTSPQGQGQGSIQGEGKGQEQGEGQEARTEKKEPKKKPELEPVIIPFETVEFRAKWEQWKHYRSEIKKPYRSAMSEQAALKGLAKYPEPVAIEMIETSIANGWQGLFELKNNTSTNGTKTATGLSQDKRTANLRNIAEGIARRLNEPNSQR